MALSSASSLWALKPLYAVPKPAVIAHKSKIPENLSGEVRFDTGMANISFAYADWAGPFQREARVASFPEASAGRLDVQRTRWVRAQEWSRDTVLIAVTGWGQQHDRSATLEAGFDEHLVKPVSPQEILGTLARHLEK